MAYDENTKQDPQDYWDRGVNLLTSFGDKHTEIGKVREITRLRKIPDKVMEGKYIITARNAMGWAIAQQMRAFFDPAPRKVEVSTQRPAKKKDKDTTKSLGWWLLGTSDKVNREASDPESTFIWNGVESGMGIIGAAFDPYRAKQGKFPIEVMVPDPACSAMARSAYGLTDFVSQEIRTVAAVRDELAMYAKRSKGKIILPDCVIDGLPTEALEDTRYFDKCYECRFIDGTHVYTRRHLLGRVPFDVADWYNVQSDRPEEWGPGVISPVRDLLEAYQQIIDIVSTDLELAQRPLGILFDGRKYTIVQLGPGEEFNITNSQEASLTPVPYQANYQVLHELAGLIGEQIDTAALPRNTFSGPQFKLSGFAVEKYIQGIQSRVDFLKRAPERALGFHYEMRLDMVRRFATKEVAAASGCHTSEYVNTFLSSFNVHGFGAKVEGNQEERVWLAVSADDVPEQLEVKVDISPNVPSDETSRMARTKEALAMGMPFEVVMRTIYKAENLDELLAMRDIEMLMQGDEMFRTFMMDHKKDKLFLRDKGLGKAWLAWQIAQGLMDDPNNPNPNLTSGQPEGALGQAQDLNFVSDDELLQQQMAQQMAQQQGQQGGMPAEMMAGQMGQMGQMGQQGQPGEMPMGAPPPMMGSGGDQMQALASAMGLA